VPEQTLDISARDENTGKNAVFCLCVGVGHNAVKLFCQDAATTSSPLRASTICLSQNRGFSDRIACFIRNRKQF
jgi:hypothetical protein